MARSAADKELADAACEAVSSKLEQLGWRLGDLEPAERTLIAAVHARGVIGNGGFRYFYERHHEIEPGADAFEEFGYREAAEACRQSASVFPGRRPPQDSAARDEFLERHARENKKTWEPLERVVWRIEYEELDRRLARHVRENAEAFKQFKSVRRLLEGKAK